MEDEERGQRREDRGQDRGPRTEGRDERLNRGKRREKFTQIVPVRSVSLGSPSLLIIIL